jgi:hypothetical protein
VSPHGFWLFIGERELFVSFEDFPWFRDASIRQITHVEMPSAHHLHWPDLDIDLAADSLAHPERYPLISQSQRERHVPPARAGRASGGKRASRPRVRG